MIDKTHFVGELTKTAVALNREPDHLIYDVFWESVSLWQWTNEEFTVAMKACRDELERFPTLKHIKERFVKTKIKAIDSPAVIYSPFDDAEIEYMIESTIKSERLRLMCRKFLKMKGWNEHETKTAENIGNLERQL